MALITATNIKPIAPATNEYRSIDLRQWAMGPSDTAEPIAMPRFSDRSVQVAGTFDGATVAIQGTLDGVNWATLTDPQGNALTFTTAKIESIAELVASIRPSLSGAGASTSLTITLIGRA